MGRVSLAYYQSVLRRKVEEMFCRNFSSAAASRVAERLLSPLPVIHHSDNEKFKYPQQSAGPRTRELFPMVMMARASGSSEINRISGLIKSFHQSFVNILIKSNLNRASQAGGDVTITSDTAIHHPGQPHTRHHPLSLIRARATLVTLGYFARGPKYSAHLHSPWILIDFLLF